MTARALLVAAALLGGCGDVAADGDGDGFVVPVDCDDADPAVYPDAGETCGNGIDDDCDGHAGDCGPDGRMWLADARARISAPLDSTRNGSLHGLAAIGDTDGDGIADVAVGYSGYQLDGAVWVLAGLGEGEVSLDAHGPSFVGADGEEAGQDVAGGDLDGDGLADLAVLATPLDAGDERAHGRVYLVDGPVGTAAAATAWIEIPGESFWGGLAVVPDTGGDGAADLVISNREAGYPESTGGSAWLLAGAATGAVDLDVAGVRIDGDTGAFGRSIAGGDLDGDGVGDLVVGDDGAGGAGRVYLFRGPLTADRVVADADGTCQGSFTDGQFGYAVSAGDSDGDGRDDVLVAAPGDAPSGEGEGAAWLFLGWQSGAASSDEAAAVVLADNLVSRIEGAVDLSADVDADGRTEVVVSADMGCWMRGCVSLFHGPVTGTLTVGAGDAVMVGEGSYDYAGQELAGAGDVDGDGFGDLLVLAPGVNLPERRDGAVYLVGGGLGF